MMDRLTEFVGTLSAEDAVALAVDLEQAAETAMKLRAARRAQVRYELAAILFAHSKLDGLARTCAEAADLCRAPRPHA